MSTTESKLLGCLLQLLCLFATASATCNVCNAVNNMACYSSTQLQACDATNLPTLIPTSCPAGNVCVSGAAGALCEPSSTTTVADCQDCNKCDASMTFACTSTSTFALCLGTTTPQTSLGTCETGYVCNVNNALICGSVATQAVPTCSYADDPTTTTATTPTTPTTAATPSTENANAYCSAVRSRGPFAVGNYTETTCRQYISCYLLNGVWRGQKYTCPGRTYYNPTSRLCVTAIPTTCFTPTFTTTTTTVAPTTSNPNAYCAQMQIADYFPVGTLASSTCRQYIYCYRVGTSWYGSLYTCPGSTYYDSATKQCVAALPALCTGRIASLSLNGIELE
ncbi:integumentary mucin C.1 [Drosophila hydei]|uniref:Integumentary mucin C.1 n=1 Tax=Drosophila hydei TaxID=7224 RepID=A0A6J2SUL2_DROHY|nr:integumentary mucin C.1 [Drosophila hydei]